MNDLRNFYNTVIVGSGPSGLATSIELVKNGFQGKEILIIDMGVGVRERVISREQGSCLHNTSGLGGAGLFSDGKLYRPYKEFNLFPNSLIDENESRSLYESAYSLISDLGFPINQVHSSKNEIDDMQQTFNSIGVFLDYYDVAQIEPAYLPNVLESIESFLLSSGVTIKLNCLLRNITITGGMKRLVITEGTQFTEVNCENLVIAVGKMGSKWINEQAKLLGIDFKSRPIELGCRVEVPAKIMDGFTRIHKDLKLIKKVNSNISVKTFCVCSKGKVSPCYYDDMVLLGGYTDIELSQNTNFALLVRIDQLGIDPLIYGYEVVRLLNCLGNNKPILQRLGDLRQGNPSNQSRIFSNKIKTTLPLYTLSDIGLGMPKIIIDAIINTLNTFSKAIPGIDDDDVLISAPCLEFCYSQFLVSRNMQTNQPGIYIVGDVAGYAKGIIPALASGILAGRGIISNNGK